MSLQIESCPRPDGECVATLRGELDVYTSPKLKQTLVDLLDQGTLRIVLDLNGVDYLDSTGLGVLLGGTRRVTERGGTLAVVCTDPRILRIFEITGLVRLFHICSSEGEALARAGG